MAQRAVATATEIPGNVVFANMQAFPEYAKRLLALAAFFIEKKHA